MYRKKGQQQNKTKLIMKGNPKGYFKNDTKVNFKVPKSNSLYNKVQDTPLFPRFNFDKKYYTPTFILHQVEVMKEQDYFALHKHKVEESIKQLDIDEILVPKPRSKHMYCGVCRDYYEEYLDHVESTEHKNKLQQSNFQKYIASECKKFQDKYCDPDLFHIQKSVSIQTKINDDQNSTQSIIEHKKDKNEEIREIPLIS